MNMKTGDLVWGQVQIIRFLKSLIWVDMKPMELKMKHGSKEQA